MRTNGALLVASLVSASCVQDTDAFGPASGRYTKSEFDAKLAALEVKVGLLDACHEGDVLVRAPDGWTCTSGTPCPPGFSPTVEQSSITVCSRSIAMSDDVMVKVGDFWIDRYEMSACPGGNLGAATGQDTTAAGCSVAGVSSQANISWFQASALCANAGKHLCTNVEWQTAVSGTPDPGASSGSDGSCLTQASGPRMTGLGSLCRSRFGAEDMIGNLWEWVADWYQAGPRWQTDVGQAPVPRAGVAGGPWPPGYQDDETWNLNGTAVDAIWQNGLPAAALRGGDWNSADRAGAFALNLDAGPPLQSTNIGARCCLGRQ